MFIIAEIDKKIATVEKEMHGDKFYPAFSEENIDIVKQQQLLKDELNEMLKLTLHARREYKASPLKSKLMR